MRELQNLSDKDIVSYFNSYMRVGLAGRRKNYEIRVKELEKAGRTKEANKVRKIAQKYRELEGILHDYQNAVRMINSSSRINTPEELERRLEIFKQGLKTSKAIIHFKLANTGSLVRHGIDSITAPDNNRIPVRIDAPYDGVVWWPGMKQALAEMNKRVKRKMDTLTIDKTKETTSNSHKSANVSLEDKLIKKMNDFRLSTMLDIIGVATIAQNDPYGIYKRVEFYRNSYEQFCNELREKNITIDVSRFSPERFITETNTHIAEEMMEHKERYINPNNSSKDGTGVVNGMVTSTCLMEPEQVGTIYRNMVIAFEREGVYQSDILQANFISTVYHMMKNQGKLDKKEKLTKELANKICEDVLKVEPIYKAESLGDYGPSTTKK